MRPSSLKTRIFLDSGDPSETRESIKLLGFLDGQTTNPTLIAKNPDVKKRVQHGKKFTTTEIYNLYKTLVIELSRIIPDGSISIEVYADFDTTAEQMFEQGQQMNSWISNAHIKYPTTGRGLKAAEKSIKEGMRTNMTLCFSQEQAAAVYTATQGAKKGQVFLSPFVGRLDDVGENGIDLIKNIIGMYKSGDHHVEVLTASVRTFDHFMHALSLGSDIVTAPFKILKEWGEKGMPLPDNKYSEPHSSLKPIEPLGIDLRKPWQLQSIDHELTTKGIERFAQDWNSLVNN